MSKVTIVRDHEQNRSNDATAERLLSDEEFCDEMRRVVHTFGLQPVADIMMEAFWQGIERAMEDVLERHSPDSDHPKTDPTFTTAEARACVDAGPYPPEGTEEDELPEHPDGRHLVLLPYLRGAEAAGYIKSVGPDTWQVITTEGLYDKGVKYDVPLGWRLPSLDDPETRLACFARCD